MKKFETMINEALKREDMGEKNPSTQPKLPEEQKKNAGTVDVEDPSNKGIPRQDM